jgi:16S rRNA processing protein RimM
MDVVVGRVGRAHGIGGEVSVEVRTDEPDRRFAVGATLTTEPAAAGPLTVRSSRQHGRRLLVRFDEVADRGAAEMLRGILLSASIDDASRPQCPDEFFDQQLVGLAVHTEDDAAVGEVVRVEHAPAHDLLVVRRFDGVEVLVPFVTALVPTVDLTAGRITVADRPGLLDPESLG